MSLLEQYDPCSFLSSSRAKLYVQGPLYTRKNLIPNHRQSLHTDGAPSPTLDHHITNSYPSSTHQLPQILRRPPRLRKTHTPLNRLQILPRDLIPHNMRFAPFSLM